MDKKHVKIISKMNGMALTIGQKITTFGKKDIVLVSKYNNSLRQKFIIQPFNKQSYIITNLHQGKVLDVEGANKQIYTPILVYQYHGGPNQQWILLKQQKGYLIKCLKTDQVLQIYGGIDFEGMEVVQNICYKNLNQYWLVQDI